MVSRRESKILCQQVVLVSKAYYLGCLCQGPGYLNPEVNYNVQETPVPEEGFLWVSHGESKIPM